MWTQPTKREVVIAKRRTILVFMVFREFNDEIGEIFNCLFEYAWLFQNRRNEGKPH